MKMQSGKIKGYILVVTMIFCGLILFLLINTGMSKVQIQLLNDVIFAERALDACYALENAAIAEMMYDPAWDKGFDREYFKDDMATAFMIFEKNKKIPALPYSYNNYEGSKTTQGWDGREIPPGYANLVIPAMAPDNSYDPKVNPFANHYLRQSMVRIYREFFFEDFNKDGNGSEPRHTWTSACDPPLDPDHDIRDKVPPVHYQDSYCYLGQKSPYWHDVFIEAGETDWKNYEMEAIVAYYGCGAFGIYMHAAEPQNGYGVLFAPRAGEMDIPNNCTLQGGSILFCYTKKIRTWTDYSPDQYWEPFDVDNSRISMDWYSDDTRHNPFMKEENETSGGDLLYGMWKITLSASSVKDGDKKTKIMKVSMTPIKVSGDASSPDLEEMKDEKWTSPEIKAPDDFCDKGLIGFYCEPGTLIAFTNVLVRKKGRPLVEIPAQWHEK